MRLRCPFLLLLSAMMPLKSLSMGFGEIHRADQVTDADTIVELAELSVAAIKSGTNILDRPVAASVVTPAEIRRQNIVTMKQVSEIAPNFYIPDYGSRMTSSIYVRGMGARIDQPVVGLNVDNVPVLNKDNYDFDLVDIESIEVIRGAQSTLYGRNAMGGVINISTLSPLRFQGVRLMAEGANGGTARAAASVYGMLMPGKLGMSLSGYYSHTDGFFRNAYTGRLIDGSDSGMARWKTSWIISESVKAENSASVTVSRQGGYPYESVELGDIAHNDTCFYRRTSVMDGLTLSARIGNVSLTSMTSLQYIDDNMTLDQDFRPEDYFTLTQRRTEWALTEDIIARIKRGAWHGMTGLFGFRRATDMHAPVTFKDYGISQLVEKYRNMMNPDYPIRWDDRRFVLDSRFDQTNFGGAIYHQSNLTLGAWRIEAGLRLDVERVTLRYHCTANTSFTTLDATTSPVGVYANQSVNIDDRDRLTSTYVELLPRVAVMWSPESSGFNAWVNLSKGYKAGGYNTQMFSDVMQQRLRSELGLPMAYSVSDIISYRPEESWNVELGGRYAMPDGRVEASLTTFFIDCRDQQLTTFPAGMTTGRIMTNAGRSRSIGVEASATVKIAEPLRATVAYGLADARFVSYRQGKESYHGKRIPYAPANTLFASLNFSRALRWNVIDHVDLTATCRGVGDIMWDDANLYRQPFYATADFTASLSHRHLTLTLWGENVTSTRYATFYFVSIGNHFVQRARPARWGATLRCVF